ncbi:RHS repeat-associated core domain-containing protein [Hydrogenophaga sp. YM1]|uniref:DUF6531 domain-containing protein n=1 Tax=Hydrogenophaga sp. YM1 TaxID=2806262 RepID=UPI0019566542|nr:DUF6531 domain-containing protein [Hydrogenophaga sp. YM1]QRR33052.1 RHS repeat-associated core domain-containing protein [Hydrogenophaga sp. YM1]
MSFILSTLLRAKSDRRAPARALWVRPTLAVALLLSAPLAQATCDPSVSCCAGAPSTGSPCGGAGVATLGNTSGVDSGAGNPLNVLGGNKFQREVDMPALPGVLGLELIRYYNSADSERHLLGRGWRLSYETTLRVGTGALAGALEVVQADGTRIAFALPPDERQGPGQGQGDLYRGLNPLQGLVHRLHTPRGSEYLWRWADGRQLRFNTRGQLEQIRAPSGEFLSLRYDGRGWLSEVIDPAGRRLRLHVLDKASAQDPQRYRGVQGIDTPVGRFVYEHGGQLPEGSSARPSEPIANLSQVIYPAQAPSEGGAASEMRSRRYHYEDPRFPTLLTGISAQRLSRHGQARNERLNTWAYDEERRAVLSFKGERPSSTTGTTGTAVATGQDQVSLQHGPTEHGQRTTVLANSLGQRTVYTSTTIAGEPRLLQAIGPGCASCTPGNRRYGYDRVGRLIEETTLDEKGHPLRSTRTERDAYGRPVKVSTITYQNGKAQPAQWRARYEYAAIDASDPYAVPSPQPVLIATPSVVPGKERLTRIAYNAAMQPVEVTEEGFSPVDEQGQFNPQGVAIRRSTTYGYAQINGRSVLSSVDGPLPNGPTSRPEDSDITRYEWDARADHLQRIVRPGPRPLDVHREPESGRIVGLSGPDGLSLPLPQPVPVWDAPQQSAAPNADLNGHAGLSGRADLLIEHDPWARPVAWRTVAGAASGTASGDDSEALLSATWGPPGSVAESSVLGFATPHAQAQRRLDDFARVVAIRHPGQGWQFARHDEAGRLLLTIDPRGARQRARWDLAGRLVRLERFAPGAEAGTTAEQVIERRYEHERLAEERISDKYGQRITRLSYDERGALASETLRIEPAGALRAALPEPIQLSLAYRREADGRLSRTLTGADGRRLGIAYLPSDAPLDGPLSRPLGGPVTRIRTEGALPAWLGGGRDIVRDIRWQDLGALRYATAITHGDGSVDRFEPVPPPAQPETSRSGLAGSDTASWLAPPGQEHDSAGLPSRISTSQGVQRLHWNAAGQLERTEREDGGHSDYLYDARGRRVIQLVSEAKGQVLASLSLYEDSRLVAEADAQGRLTYAHVHLGYRPVAQIPLQPASAWQRFTAWLLGPEARHLHTTRAGRVLSVSEQGRTVWRDGERGAERGAGPSEGPDERRDDGQSPRIHQPLRYVGQVHDADSGLSYHGARFFEPTQGRFISPDPAGIADAINDLPAGLLLDLYAYAGGRPDAYFDPDGAARIRYFAITTDAKDKALGIDQGFVKARWAFIVDDVQGGGDASALGQKRNEYARAASALLVDVGGNFLGGGQAASAWGGADNPMAADFFQHYGEALIAIPEFTIDNMSDDDATALIASYIQADREQVFGRSCPSRAALLPPIRFAPGETDIHVDREKEPPLTGLPGNQANAQRILNCNRPTTLPVAYANDEERRRIAKYEAAAELQESPATSAIYKDCSANNGCRSNTAIKINGHEYYASYGRTQFVVETFLRTLRTMAKGLSAQQRHQLRLDQPVRLPNGSMGTMLDMVGIAMRRAQRTGAAFEDQREFQLNFGGGMTAADAWIAMNQGDRDSFKNDTGFGQQEFIDMLSFTPEGRARTNGEAKNAFSSEAVMRLLDGDGKASFKEWLMWLYASQDEYAFISKMYLKRTLSSVVNGDLLRDHFKNSETPGSNAHYQRQREIETDLAQRMAAMHNWGNVRRIIVPEIKLPPGVQSYVDEFTQLAGRGDWRALRCSDELKNSPGLRMVPLKLN